MTRAETTIFVLLLVLIIGWALLGPGGWISGLIGAVVGAAVGIGMVLARRQRTPR